jgi:hypothetical protein
MEIKDIRETAKRLLLSAQREFNKRPSSGNWCTVLNWMAAHQQATAAKGDFIKQLEVNLDTVPLTNWPDAIVQTTCSMTTAQLIAGDRA